MAENNSVGPPRPVSNRARTPLSRGKRILFSVLLVLLTYGLLEGLSWLGLNWMFGSIPMIQSQLQYQSGSTMNRAFERNSPVEDRHAFPTEVVHPYLGYVQRPIHGAVQDGELQFGLATTKPIRRRSKDQVLVAVVGGSVAEYFSADAGHEFCHRLEELPEFSGRKAVLVPLGMRSYKQPQQVMLINYLMTLGAEFDYLINIDGYNEVVLPATFNGPHHVFPSYPREWDLRVAGATDVETVQIVGRIAYLRGASQRWAALFDRPYLQSSPLALVIWNSFQVRFQSEAARQYEKW